MPGFALADLGKCEHAIGLKGDEYEIGLVRRRDGRPGWLIVADDGSEISEYSARLKQAYAAEVSIKQARMQGFGVREELRADGSLRITMSK